MPPLKILSLEFSSQAQRSQPSTKNNKSNQISRVTSGAFMLIFCENYICTMCTLAHLKVLCAAGQLHGRRVRPPPLQTAGRARPVLQDLDISLPARGVNICLSIFLFSIMSQWQCHTRASGKVLSTKLRRSSFTTSPNC